MYAACPPGKSGRRCAAGVLGLSRLWLVATIEEGIEVLTGVRAGKDEDGGFAQDGNFARVNQRLTKKAEELVKFNGRSLFV